MIGSEEESVSRASARALAVILFLSAPVALAEGQGAPEGVTPEAALAKLKDGNQRYATSAVKPRHYRAERPTLTKGQKPYAIVLSCADSRVPPEIVFDESARKALRHPRGGKRRRPRRDRIHRIRR